ncbi:hypothetical protein B0H66DRAFT_550575 [Apodospora peruviana]|uniref:Uncharacterized protein n=1 Tax=Apodospora peruviana TaxID=516989 RepID=A0AAE0IJS8_9PEZI|nr:hypothetical protein B0H66DRAFT_550575 [Apodospora peruviana]
MAGYLEKFSKWLQLKIYQLEVTLSVYMFTPNEKFVFYSVFFLLFSLTFIATVLYLPQHVQFIAHRAWFYMHGDEVAQNLLVKSGSTTPQVVTQAVVVAVGQTTASLAKGEL